MCDPSVQKGAVGIPVYPPEHATPSSKGTWSDFELVEVMIGQGGPRTVVASWPVWG